MNRILIKNKILTVLFFLLILTPNLSKAKDSFETTVIMPVPQNLLIPDQYHAVINGTYFGKVEKIKLKVNFGISEVFIQKDENHSYYFCLIPTIIPTKEIKIILKKHCFKNANNYRAHTHLINN